MFLRGGSFVPMYQLIINITDICAVNTMVPLVERPRNYLPIVLNRRKACFFMAVLCVRAYERDSGESCW